MTENVDPPIRTWIPKGTSAATRRRLIINADIADNVGEVAALKAQRKVLEDECKRIDDEAYLLGRIIRAVDKCKLIYGVVMRVQRYNGDATISTPCDDIPRYARLRHRIVEGNSVYQIEYGSKYDAKYWKHMSTLYTSDMFPYKKALDLACRWVAFAEFKGEIIPEGAMK